MSASVGRVLIIAGSDSGGGAGIQGDIKTVTCLGGYAATAINTLTAQNTQGVYGIQEVPAAFIKQQISLVMEDIGADCIKTGMLHSAAVIETVAAAIKPYTDSVKFVLDPVMFAKGGEALLEPDALSTLKESLIPLATLITPNIPEAELLSGTSIRSLEDMIIASKAMLAMGCKAVLLKGGHLQGENITDLLVHNAKYEPFIAPRIISQHTHGTGCTLASAIATGLAQNLSMIDAVRRARAYVRRAIESAPKLGKGHGPLGHNHTVKKYMI